MHNSKNFSLIVPAAGDTHGNGRVMPYIFNLDKEGIMLCVKAITGLNLDIFDKVYFTILQNHVDAFNIDKMLELQIKRLGMGNAEIVILDSPTSSQPETIAATIKEKNIEGSIFIKDADSYFEAEVFPENSVAVFPLENLSVVDPRNKSYVAIDDLQHVTNIIEKRIISNLFSTGGYGFEDVNIFLKAFYDYLNLGKLYLSHLIYGLLLTGQSFIPIKVKEYIDFSIKV